MKTTIDVPEKTLKEAMLFTGATTKRAAVLTALETFNRLNRLAKLNSRVRGRFRDFMTQEEPHAARALDTVKVL